MDRIDETWHRLREWTYGPALSERLAAQVLIHDDYAVDPSHPLGGPDGGRDATCTKDGKTWIMAVYSPRGEHSFKEIEAKFSSDLAKARTFEPYGFVFVTNQELRLSEREQFQAAASEAGLSLDLYHLERMAVILDAPRMAPVREQYLKIEPGPMSIGIELDIEGAARYFENSDRVCESYIRHNSGKALAAQAPPRTGQNVWIPDLYAVNLTGEASHTDEELRVRLSSWSQETRRGWAESERYLAAHTWPGLRFGVTNVGGVYLNNVQVIITVNGAQGLGWERQDDFDEDEFVKPVWPKPYRFKTPMIPRSVFRGNPVTWKNTTADTVQIILDVERLPPIPKWESDNDDVTLLATDPSVKSLTATWTVTAQGYGAAYEGPAHQIPITGANHSALRSEE